MRIAALSAPPVPAPMEQPVVRVLMDDGESYLTHEMEGASGDGRLPQLTFTTNKEHAKLFQVTDWDDSTRTFGLRCDLGFLTNADGEVRAGAQKKSKHETWTADANGAMSNQDQFQAGYLEVWSASLRGNGKLAGTHKDERVRPAQSMLQARKWVPLTCTLPVRRAGESTAQLLQQVLTSWL